MRINGNKLAEKIQKELVEKTYVFLDKGIQPKIAVVTVGEEDTWKVYVGRKLALAKQLGIAATIYNLKDFEQEDLEQFITNLNEDRTTHGIIIQRPIPKHFDESRVVNLVRKEKDIDGFRPDSPFASPVAEAVRVVIEEIYKKDWKGALEGKRVVVLGKGATGGGPTIQELRKIGVDAKVIDSRSGNREELLKNADVIISAVGKKVLTSGDIKNGAVVIGIGARVEGGKLKGDFDARDIATKVKAYTPTPGGIGPLNLTFLFTNLLKATGLLEE